MILLKKKYEEIRKNKIDAEPKKKEASPEKPKPSEGSWLIKLMYKAGRIVGKKYHGLLSNLLIEITRSETVDDLLRWSTISLSGACLPLIFNFFIDCLAICDWGD